MITDNIEGFIIKLLRKDKTNPNSFLKKLAIHWNEIVENPKFARYSSPSKIISENNKATLIIFSYDGSVTVYLQSMIKRMEQNIKLHIGYFPVSGIRIIQKSPFV